MFEFNLPRTHFLKLRFNTKQGQKKWSRSTLRPACERLEDRRVLATVTVSLAADAANPTDLDDGITLREAIGYINGDTVPAGDLARIDLTEGFGTNDRIIFNLPPGEDTIRLGRDAQDNVIPSLQGAAGELAILDRSLVIEGPGAELLTIDASGTDNDMTVNNGGGSRVFEITISDMLDGARALQTNGFAELRNLGITDGRPEALGNPLPKAA